MVSDGDGTATGGGRGTVGDTLRDAFGLTLSGGVEGRGGALSLGSAEAVGNDVEAGAGDSAGPACASNFEREDGPAIGEDADRARGNKCDVGGRVALKDSSTSGSGGPAGMVPVSAAGRSCAVDGSKDGSAIGVFFAGSRRLEGYDGCVQSSTSSM